MTQPNAEALARTAKADSVAIMARAESLTIANPEELTASGELLRDIAGKAKQVKAQLKTITDPLAEATKAAKALFAPVTDELAAADGTVRRAVLTYQQEERRKAAAAQAIEDAKARKRREELDAQADRHENAGREERAEERRDESAATTAPIVEEPAAPAGVSTRTTWKARVTDLKELAAAVGRGEQPESLIAANMPALNALAKGAREGLKVPGVEAWKDESLAVRS